MTLEEFCSMLFSANIHVFTDHKNVTFDELKTQRVLHWHNKIEEFLPWLHYIEGPRNILADNLSRLLCLPSPTQITERKKLVEPAIVSDDEDDKEGFLATCKNLFMTKMGFLQHAKTLGVLMMTSTTFLNVI